VSHDGCYRGSPEREVKDGSPGLEKLNLKLSIDDRSGLPDQLVHPRFGKDAIALFVAIRAVRAARAPSVDEDAKSQQTAARWWANQHQTFVRLHGASLDFAVFTPASNCTAGAWYNLAHRAD
jgi:hypothetical protein